MYYLIYSEQVGGKGGHFYQKVKSNWPVMTLCLKDIESYTLKSIEIDLKSPSSHLIQIIISEANSSWNILKW